MIPGPVPIQASKLAAALLNLLDRPPVDELVVLDEENHPVGLVDTQDLIRPRIL